MLNRLSNILGCPVKDDSSEDSSWLSATTGVRVYFAVSLPYLQEILQKIGVLKSESSAQFYLAPAAFLPTSDPKSDFTAPWAIAHSAQKRCNHLQNLLSGNVTLGQKIVHDLRTLASKHSEDSVSYLATFSHLLCPLLTSTIVDSELPTDDVLLLFGSPSSAFQILLFTPIMRPLLTDLILELVAGSSVYSEQLLDQFRQPVGLTTLFSDPKSFIDTSARILELFQILDDPDLQAKVLEVLPELASSPCSSGCVLSEEDRSLLVSQLINLLDTIPVDRNYTNSTRNPIICLIECLTKFSIHGELAERLHSAFFDLLDRCLDCDSYFDYLLIIIRCLLINGPVIPQNQTDLSKLIGRIRKYFAFPRSISLDVAEVLGSDLVNLLRVIFQFNRNVASEWIHIINSDYTANLADVVQRQQQQLPHLCAQASQDFIVICIALSTPTMAFKTNNASAIGEKSYESFCTSESYHFKRLKSESITGVRRIVSSGLLVDFAKINESVHKFIDDYGYILMSEKNRLFLSFLFILNQLVNISSLRLVSKTITRYVGLIFYTETFCSHACTSYHKREMLGYLCRVLTANSKYHGILRGRDEMNTRSALFALLRLAQVKPKELAKFDTCIKQFQQQVDKNNINSIVAKLSSHSDFSVLPRKENIRLIFSVLAHIAFSVRENRCLQDSLLIIIRNLLSDESLMAKCTGVVGATVILELLCRRESVANGDVTVAGTKTFADEDDSIILASQLNVADANTSINTTRSSNASSLSLKGPGTGLADDPNEVDLLVDDTIEGEVEEDRQAEKEKTDCSIDSHHSIVPPSRLMLQLVGLVEYAVRGHPQLHVLWLDELTQSFVRVIQWRKQKSSDKMSFSQKNVWIQGKRFIYWMGARIMRNFQDDFILDNVDTSDDYTTHFSLHDSNVCGIAIAIGPTWHKYYAQLLQSNALTSVKKAPVIPYPNLHLLPPQLNLLSVIETFKHGDDSLDGIDALLGCPLFLPMDYMTKAQLVDLCINNQVSFTITDPHLLIFIINWFVEAVNVFSPKSYAGARLNSQANCKTTSPTPSVNTVNATHLRHISILIRLRQIACLRKSLYMLLCDRIHEDNLLLSDEQFNHKSLNTGPVGNLSQSQAKQSRTTLYSIVSDLCLPTSSYQPENGHTNYHKSFVNAASNRLCFDSGVHLKLKTKASNTIGSKLTKRKGCTKKAKSGKTNSKVSKLTSQQEIGVDCTNVESADSDSSEVVGRNLSSSRSAVYQSLSADNEKYQNKGMACKFAAIGGKSNKRLDDAPVSSNLFELITCFRELDIRSIVFGLSAWPWIIEISDVGEIDKSCSTESNLDWTTLNWLVDELTWRLEYLSGITQSTFIGWHQFERLNMLDEKHKSCIIVSLVPNLYRILKYVSEFFEVNNKLALQLNNDSLSSLSSDNEGDGTSDSVLQSNRTKLTVANNETVQSVAMTDKQIIEIRNQVTDIYCNLLQSFLLVLHDLKLISNNSDQYFFDPSSAQSSSDLFDQLSIDSINLLANTNAASTAASDHDSDIAPHSLVLHLNCTSGHLHSNDAGFKSKLRKIFLTPDCIIDQDKWSDNLNTIGIVRSSSPSNSETIVNRQYVDLFDVESQLRLDLLAKPKFDSDFDELLFVNLRTVIDQFLQLSNFPQASAALLHCRLIFHLSSMYYRCQVRLANSGFNNTQEKNSWTPDLFSYTKTLLNQNWDSSFKWKGHNYRECIQGLLGFHLRSHFYTSTVDESLTRCSDLLKRFTCDLVLPTIRRYQNLSCDSVQSSLNSQSIDPTAYQSLTQQTVDVYCREVMETVIWLGKHLCNLPKRSTDDCVTVSGLNTSSILSQWNQCVEIMCTITSVINKSARLTDCHSFGKTVSKQNFLFQMLPTMMRTGRQFLQSLLKGAMPLLSASFRTRGVEVTTILRNTQQLTRFLQRVCTHAKAYRDSQLTNQIPATKHCLETFVYRVKIMLSQNRCVEAFWLGTLKNRDLHGIEVGELRDESNSVSNCSSSQSQSLSVDIDGESVITSNSGSNVKRVGHSKRVTVKDKELVDHEASSIDDESDELIDGVLREEGSISNSEDDDN